jgi:hypothetical protein
MYCSYAYAFQTLILDEIRLSASRSGRIIPKSGRYIRQEAMCAKEPVPAWWYREKSLPLPKIELQSVEPDEVNKRATL